MARIEPLNKDELTDVQKADWDRLVKQGHLTNMQRTIIRDHETYVAYDAWHTSWNRLVEIVGLRAATVFAHAISEINECQLCSLYFVADLKKLGIQPQDFHETEEESILVKLGREYVKDPTSIQDEVFDSLFKYWTANEIIAIIGFAGQMVATNDFNSAIGINLDDRLLPLQPEFKPSNWRTRNK